MKGTLYVVTMYRRGDRNNHSYLLGVYSTKTKAEKNGERELAMRGGKYYPECIEITPDVSTTDGMKIIVPLKRSPVLGNTGESK
jgi:hypothetical protein